MKIDVITHGHEPVNFDELAARITVATGLPVIELEERSPTESEELDALLRESLVHIHNLLHLLAGDLTLGKHEYILESTSFWKVLRDGMCPTSITDLDGVIRMCPNQIVSGFGLCESCQV